MFLSCLACAQQRSQSPAKKSSSQPQVRVNMLNVCTPSKDEQQQIASALSRVPKQPLFSQDFEVDRGRSTLEEQPDFLPLNQRTHVSRDTDSAAWVRIRREFAVQALYSTVQYSFSLDPKSMIETLVFKVREPKDLLQVSIEDDASSVTSPAAMLGTNTPVSRIRLERFGKASVVLARCSATATGPAPDQSAYEPLFQTASAIGADYRNLLKVPQTVPEELDRVASVESKHLARKTSKKPIARKSSLPHSK
ncbi:MAG: hypothetical protein ACRD2S_07420 [Terriglobales bacterium]